MRRDSPFLSLLCTSGTRRSPARIAAIMTATLLAYPSLEAATIVADGTTCTLVDAITSANNDSATGGCTAGFGADLIELTTDVTLTTVNNTSGGESGLPPIATEIEVKGLGASPPRAIVRDGGAPDFRIFHVAEDGILALDTVAISDGLAAGRGGGIFNRGRVTLTNSTLSGNSAIRGGGIDNFYGTVTLTNSTVSGNSANIGGGGIYNYGTVTLTNSTVSGNSAASAGGGIYNFDTVTLTNSTVSGNSADYGGGIYNFYGTVTVTASLVANSSGGNCVGTITDDGSNLADDATCGTIPNTLTGLDATLSDNGGPTMTHALLAGSTAIDAAGACGLSTDQRGFIRVDGLCDAGSFEVGALEVQSIFEDGFESGNTSAWSRTVP